MSAYICLVFDESQCCMRAEVIEADTDEGATAASLKVLADPRATSVELWTAGKLIGVVTREATRPADRW
jgi:hypothetical protein